MYKSIILSIINLVFVSSYLYPQGDFEKEKSGLFKIEVIDTTGTNALNNHFSKRILQFKNSILEIDSAKIVAISKDGFIAGVRELFYIDDTVTSLVLYDTNGAIKNSFIVPSTPFTFSVSNSGAFALIGTKPTRYLLEHIDTTYLYLYDPKGNLVYKNSDAFGPTFKEAFSDSGSIYVYLTSTLKFGLIKLLIFKNLNNKPEVIETNIDNWPNRPSLYTTALFIDENKRRIKIFRHNLINNSPVEIKKETLFYSLEGEFLKMTKGWVK